MATNPKPRRFDREVDGILLLDKPIGLSSNAALQQARIVYRALKAGHAGSLDPLASGMLPVCFGQATKVCAFLLDSAKAYRFTAKLGERSDTGDAEGEIVDRQSVPPLSRSKVESTLQSFVGEQQQIPPMYSALKHKGERLYRLARRGESVERAPRRILIDTLELHSLSEGSLQITVRCSKGTYVRTLAEDIAHALGTVAHLTALRRLTVDPFHDRQMHTLEELRNLEDPNALHKVLIPSDQALLHLPTCEFDACDEAAVLRGQTVRAQVAITTVEFKPVDYVRMYGVGRRFLGLGELAEGGEVHPRRLFVNRQ